MLTLYLLLFLFSLISLLLMRVIAPSIGLVDKPSYRKLHHGLIPLVGGVSVYLGICFYFFFSEQTISHPIVYLLCAGLLVFVGVLDDRFDLKVTYRLLIQVIVALAMIFYAGLSLNSLGMILGPWEFTLGKAGYVVTVFAVIGSINAFNMVDGIDGLLGGLSSVTFASLAILLYSDGQPILAEWCIAIIISILPYILLNLGALGKNYKVFMGDAGSTLIGFTVVWILLESTQGIGHPLNPVTALWVIAIPLMDMLATIYRRVRKGHSPFKPDRQHLHHIIIRSGFSSRQAFLLITLSSALLAIIGILGEHIPLIPEWGMLILFLLLFPLYNYCLKNLWRITHYRKRKQREKTVKSNADL